MKKPPTGGGFEDWSMGYRYEYELQMSFVFSY